MAILSPVRPAFRLGLMLLAGLAGLSASVFSAEANPAWQRTLTLSVSSSPQASQPNSGATSRPAGLEYEVACGLALPLSAVAFSPDGKTLAVGGYREVLLWDLDEGKLAKRIGMEQIGNMVQAVAFSKDGKTMAVAEGSTGQSGVVTILNLSSGQPVVGFREPKGVVTCLAVSPDGKLLAGGGQDGAAYVWNLEDKKLVTTLKDHDLAVLCVAFGSDGKYLATGSADKTVQVWEVGSWKPDHKKTKLESEVRRCQIRSSRPNRDDVQHMFALLVGGREDRTLQVRLDGKAPAWARKDIKAEMDAGIPLDCVWLQNKGSSKIYVACSDHMVRVFSETGQKLEQTATLRGHKDWVYAVALNPEGTRLASVGLDGTVRLWNTADNTLLATLVQLAPGTDDWLLATAQGYLAGSKKEAVTCRTTPGSDAKAVLSSAWNPDLVRQALADQKSSSAQPPVKGKR